MRPRISVCASVATIVVGLGFPSVSLAQDGSLDPAFDGDGTVTTSIGAGNDAGNAVVIQKDGKILVAGSSGAGLALVRYKTDGSPDDTFGKRGAVVTHVAPGNAVANSVALQGDGKIVLAGYHGIFPDHHVVVARYDTHGALDPAFGSGGVVSTAIGSAADQGRSVAIQADGRIVVAGFRSNGSNADILVVRYDADGSPDKTFGSGGVVTTAVGPANEVARSVVVQRDGKILVAGYSYTPRSFAYEFVVARYETNGRLDRTFDGDGVLTTDLVRENDYAESIAVQDDGKIVVGGYSFTGSLCLARYGADGALDPTFGAKGKVVTAFASAYQHDYSIAIQRDGRILLGGYGALRDGKSDFALVRYTRAGELDGTFGTSGVVTTPIGTGDDIAASVALQSDGKIVLAGKSFNGTKTAIAVVRYRNAAPAAR